VNAHMLQGIRTPSEAFEDAELTKAIVLELTGAAESFRSLDGQSRICNKLYNLLLERATEIKVAFRYTEDPVFAAMLYSAYGLRNLIPEIKEEFPFFKSVHSSPLKNAALRLTNSINAHRKCKKGTRRGIAGWPRFRSSKNWFSLEFDEPNKGYKIVGSELHLSLGCDEDGKRAKKLVFQLKEAYALRGHVPRNLRITKDAGRYYAVFTVKVCAPKKKPIKRAIALDPNHKNFAVGVDTQGVSIEIEAPFWLKQSRKRVDELKSKRDRCKKSVRTEQVLDEHGVPTGNTYKGHSRRYKKLEKVLEKASHKRREQTKTFMFSVANKLSKRYDCIGIGDYAPDGTGLTRAMRRSMNNDSLLGRFKHILRWTAAKSGKTCIEYDEKGTTRTCHICSYEVPGGLHPSIRSWLCPVCQTMHLRDENAAHNGLAKILRDLNKEGESYGSQVPCSGPVHVNERWVWRVSPSGIMVSAAGDGTARNRSARKLKKKA
jgi:putative transposase